MEIVVTGQGNQRLARKCLPSISNTQCPTAVVRVFKTPELLELVLVEVAESEVDVAQNPFRYDGTPRTWYNGGDDPKFILSPTRLRAVNRDFRDTIEGSSKLLRLQLKALFRQHDCSIHPDFNGDRFGRLHWLEHMGGFDLLRHGKIEDGVFSFNAFAFGGNEDRRSKLRKDFRGSWRKLPCLPYAKASGVTKIVLHLGTNNCMLDQKTPDGRTSYEDIELQTYDFDTNVTLGVLFAVIDAAELGLAMVSPLLQEEHEREWSGRVSESWAES
ncbi:unnamed protein product [Cercospora beticola]|nr:unnamed protein product [Cercospora beticola]